MGCPHQLRPITQAQNSYTSLHRPGALGSSSLQEGSVLMNFKLSLCCAVFSERNAMKV